MVVQIQTLRPQVAVHNRTLEGRREQLKEGLPPADATFSSVAIPKSIVTFMVAAAAAACMKNGMWYP